MIHRPPESNAFEFVRVASLRAAQLMRGCTQRVPPGVRPVVTAQLEVAAGKVACGRMDGHSLPMPFVKNEMEPVRGAGPAADRADRADRAERAARR